MQKFIRSACLLCITFFYLISLIYNNMKLKVILMVLVAVLLAASCKSPEISYFQDVMNENELAIQKDGAIRLRPGDKIAVVVHTKNQEYNNMYNLPWAPSRIGQSAEYQTAQPQGMVCYTVNDSGKIVFPVLGSVDASGKTREELAADIKNKLLDTKQLTDDPLVVTVEFANLNISILGEVTNPGRYSLTNDKVTILDALGMAKDLTIYGERDKVMVMREENGKQKTYVVDLTSAGNLMRSPVYYMQQNDIIYVKPNTVRQRQATVAGNTIYTPSFWISVASLLTTITALLVK